MFSDTSSEAYDRGYCDGYNDVLNDNPYEEGTHLWDQYEDGYRDGCNNC